MCLRLQPQYIVDPDAEMPEDWDEEEDGEWERPEIKNPDYEHAKDVAETDVRKGELMI